MGCGSGGTVQQLRPPAPSEKYLYTDKQVEARRYVSNIALPVAVSQAEIQRQLNANLPQVVFEDNSYDDNGRDDMMVKVWRRGNLLLTPATAPDGSAQLAITVPLRVWLRMRYGAFGFSAEKETQFEINVHLNAEAGLNPDWSAYSHTELQGYDWVSKPVLKLGPIDVPIAGIVGRALHDKKKSIEAGIDAATQANLAFRGYVTQAWETLMQPYQLSETYRTWLRVTPVGVQMTPFRWQGSQLTATIGLQANTETAFGERPAPPPARPLPNLVSSPTVPDNFKIGLVADLSHAEALRLASENILGKTFNYGSYAVTVHSLDLWGDEHELIIKAGLSGSLNGFIYFRGLPYYDAATQTISLKNFDYDLETRNVLFKTASWLLQGRLSRSFQEAFTFGVGPQLEAAKAAMQGFLNKNQLAKGVTLQGRLDSLTPDQVYLTPTSLLAVIFAGGRVRLDVDGL